MKLSLAKYLIIAAALIFLVVLLLLLNRPNESSENQDSTGQTEQVEVSEEEGGDEITQVPVTPPGQPCRSFADATLTAGSATYAVEIAHTRVQQATGLQGCSELTAEQGMYFIYNTAGRPSFWMKGMLIPLDLVWVRDGVVVEVTPNVPPAGDVATADIPQYQAGQDVDAVLEIAAGQAAAQGIVPGTAVELTPQ